MKCHGFKVATSAECTCFFVGAEPDVPLDVPCPHTGTSPAALRVRSCQDPAPAAYISSQVDVGHSAKPSFFFLGGGNSNIVYYHPYLGKIPILTNIFQRGWNHQLVFLALKVLFFLSFFFPGYFFWMDFPDHGYVSVMELIWSGICLVQKYSSYYGQ